MTFYSGLKSVSANLLQDKGRLLTFSRETETAFDPKTGKQNISASTYTGYGAAFNYNTKEIDGSNIQNGDIRLLLESPTTPPNNGDTATIDGNGYRIMNIKSVSPAGTVVVYQVQLRR